MVQGGEECHLGIREAVVLSIMHVWQGVLTRK